jgi:hypothetical protein
VLRPHSSRTEAKLGALSAAAFVTYFAIAPLAARALHPDAGRGRCAR